MEFTEVIQPIPIACSSTNGMDVIAIGNGNTKKSNDKIAPILQYSFKLRTIAIINCLLEFPFLIFRTSVICAAGDDLTSMCPGDSGGPLVTTDTDKLVGISSFISSYGCEDGLPQGFSRVSSHLEWIEDVTGIRCKN